MSYTVYAWWKRHPNFGGGAKQQQIYLTAETEDEAQRKALSLVERLDGAHYSTYWVDKDERR